MNTSIITSEETTYMLRRYTYIKRNVGLPKRTTNIPKVSEKRKSLLDKYYKLRELFLRKKPKCEANIPGICTHIATEVHHKEGRIGHLLLYVRKWLAVCRPCHAWIETHPAEAKANGWSISRLNDVEGVSSELTGVNSEETPSVDNTY